jgi:imidazolonepropionase-like amidohydrolase
MAPLSCALLLAAAPGGATQDSTRAGPPATVAIVGATVVPGRIVAIGPVDSVAVPPGSTIVDATGRYLLPGLADMHVHQGPEVGSRPGFGDGALYLANGVTTVLNLRGDSTTLALRAGLARGTLMGPTLYTAGEFVNEPRVNTPDEVEREVRAQAAAGFDAIKFREVLDLQRGEVLTTRGLSRDAYRRMLETARSLGIPLVGHAPTNLGLEAAIEDGQSLAHVGYPLVSSYFWPTQTGRFAAHRLIGRWAVIALGAVALLGWLAIAVATIRRRSGAIRRVALPGGAGLATAALALALLGARELWRPDSIGHQNRIAAVTFLGGALVLAAGALLLWLIVLWRRPSPPLLRAYGAAALLPALLLAGSALFYWVPLVRRGTDGGLVRLGREMARSGIWVTPTLQVYRSDEVADNPETRYVRIPPWWERFRRNAPPGRRAWARDLLAFLQHVVGLLHRERVPLLAGTDAMGWAYMIPGFSLHDELDLLVGAGLSRFEALRTATVEPARFLQRPTEFGSVAVGSRADLVLTEKNPLQDLGTLRKPLGVMARGTWYPAARLEAMLAGLEADRR